MPNWGKPELECARQMVRQALAEDLGEWGADGDLTSLLLPADLAGEAVFTARAPGVLAGLPIVPLVFEALDPALRIELHRIDGDRLQSGDCLATIRGRMRGILSGERTALNFLQRLSGVATQTARYVEAIAGLPCRILDTRKTTPGWRRLEKYAVACGGGQNHRLGLFDAVLIKDNHLAALHDAADAIAELVQRARRQYPSVPVEVEVDTLDQFDRALACGPDSILLDNMDAATLREAVARRNQRARHITLEASGGVTLATVRSIAETGVDCISVGALTHSAPALDIALDYS